ncbi:hypothetical protein XBJ1_0460 [Xenorhabdus bovienii SS-2004]|uniref:Uncharacterized protein n=1 Tax=Xenorhabdus bovienii (strain SS-2004) TaxID=406818 RepID=D3UWA0_XENBS|nr:hypothetical protein XBJ1_0460 [Xenorhabdus bovienii SS-2004]
MMVWGNGFFAKTMIPEHHAVQILLIKRQQPLVTSRFMGDRLQRKDLLLLVEIIRVIFLS